MFSPLGVVGAVDGLAVVEVQEGAYSKPSIFRQIKQ